MRFYAFLTALLFGISLSLASHSLELHGGADTTYTLGNTSSSGVGVWGVHTGASTGSGVVGSSTNGYGVYANSPNGTALVANSDNSTGISVNAYYDGIDVSSTAGPGINVGANYDNGAGIYSHAAIGFEAGAQSATTGEDAAAFEGNAFGQNGGSTYGLSVQAAYGDYVMGVYSTASSGNYETWAGYFDGDTYTGGCFCGPSDIMFKKNVQPLAGGLSKIMSLNPKSYEMKVDEFKDHVNLPKGDKFGLIAQDVEAVLPEIVHPVTAPAHLTKDEMKKHVKKDPLKFKSVDYTALIPILVEAIKEQQAEIETLKGSH